MIFAYSTQGPVPPLDIPVAMKVSCLRVDGGPHSSVHLHKWASRHPDMLQWKMKAMHDLKYLIPLEL